jgi:hypothetical protein
VLGDVPHREENPYDPPVQTQTVHGCSPVQRGHMMEQLETMTKPAPPACAAAAAAVSVLPPTLPDTTPPVALSLELAEPATTNAGYRTPGSSVKDTSSRPCRSIARKLLVKVLSQSVVSHRCHQPAARVQKALHGVAARCGCTEVSPGLLAGAACCTAAGHMVTQPCSLLVGHAPLHC